MSKRRYMYLQISYSLLLLLFLIKNGHGKFAVIDIKEQEEYENYKIAKQVSQELMKAEQSDSVSNKEMVEEVGLQLIVFQIRVTDRLQYNSL